jgi:HD-GYP domain-containing protein (c-di-GMP phosphodiesterase class II)
MRLVSIEEIMGNEIAATDVLDVNQRVLLARGTRIKLSYLNKLENLGIYQVYIEDEISEGIKVEGILCQKTKIEAKKNLEVEMENFKKKKEFDIATIENINNIIVNEILLNRVDLINLKDIKLKDEYLFSHCINVCALTVFLCMKMNLNRTQIQNIGTGSLLHDFGKLMIPNYILQKESKLTKEENIELRKHPIYGYEALKNDPVIRPTTKVAILMHHERIDGSGYPNKLKGNKIHDLVKICSICDKFDSMTSDMPYRKSISVSDTIEYLQSTAGIYFEKKFVDEFLKYVPPFPPGSIVLLNNGIVAIVIKSNPASVLRPVVRYLYNPLNKIKYNNYNVDMMEELTLKIKGEIKFNKEEYNSISKRS